MASFEEGIQHGCPATTNHGVSAWVRWIWCCVARLWKPVRVSHSLGIIIRIGSPDSGDWPPEIVSVFGIVERNHRIREGQVEQRKEAGALGRCQVVPQGCRLGDLVPIILNRSVPKAAR